MGKAIIIPGVNWAQRNLGYITPVTPVETFPLKRIISGADCLSCGGYINGSTNKFVSSTASWGTVLYVAPFVGGTITVKKATTATNISYAFLTTYTLTNGTVAPYVTGTTLVIDTSDEFTVTIPEGTTHFYFSAYASSAYKADSITLESITETYTALQSVIQKEQLTQVNGVINNSNVWQQQTNYSSCLIDISSYKGKTIKLFLPDAFYAVLYTFLTASPTIGTYVSFATGYSAKVAMREDGLVTVPLDAEYLYVHYNNNGVIYAPSIIIL